MKLKLFTTLLAFAFIVNIGWGQKSDSLDYYDLTLAELMNIKIVSASKKAENLFDASLSASVLTREEIRNSGATSIMEALRLVPGVIVREQSNGNYDIHVRGLDNVPPNSLILSSTNTTTLVMINNRPVYNYLQGGTFWESLPIDLNDVEKIEVIRGPASTLYGPNAVSGVINIITTQITKDGFTFHGTAQYGSKNTGIANSTVGYKFSEKLNVAVSGNFQTRDRANVRFFDYASDQWVNSPAALTVDNASARFPHPSKSMNKYGVNAFINYAPTEKSRFGLSAGSQDSKVQNIMFDNSVTNMSTSSTNSRYVDFQSSTYGLNTQVSYTSATQAPVLGMKGSKYDYNVMDASAEYSINVGSLSIKPGITYRSATYNDGKYWNIAAGEGTFGGKQTMNTLGGGLRFDYKLLNEKLRLTGGLRLDKFTFPDKWFSSYQAAASYKFNDKNLIRVVYSKAYRSPFIFDTFLDYKSLTPIGGGMSTQFVVTGNKNLNLLHSNMIELGYRTMLTDNLSIDIEGYSTKTNNYDAMIQDATTITPQNYPVVASTSLSMQNIPLEVQQLGTSVSLTIVVDKLQLKPFVTLQKTTLKNYSPYFSTGNAAPSDGNNFDPATYNMNTGAGTSVDHKFTPKAYGGAYINYSLSSKFNVNLTSYWFSKQTFYERDNLTYHDGVHGVENIHSKAIVNVRVAYTPVKQVSLFVTGKNLLNKKTVEYYQGDSTPAMVLGGVSVNF